MGKVRIGLVGTGFVSEWHRNAFLKNEDAEIIGIAASVRSDRAKQLASEWGIKAFKDFDDIVSCSDIDALVIGSRNPEHFSHVMKAIENGKHVLIEKPVVTDFGQLTEIKKFGQDKNVHIFAAHNFVYREAVLEAKRIITDGGIGKIMYASFNSTHTISEEHSTGWRSKLAISSGGALMDSGHHLVYMSLFFMGMPAKLQAFKSNLVLNNMEGEDIAQVNLLYPDGSLGNIMQSWTSGFENGVNGIKFVGDKGSIAITDALYFNSEKLSTDVGYDDSFRNQAKAFTDFILKGKKPVSTLEDAENALKIIYGAYESSEKNTVKIFN